MNANNTESALVATAHGQSLTAAAGLGSEPVSVESYRSPEHYILEQDRIFRRSWLMLGREEELPAPGDFVRKTIEVCGASLILARNKEGKIRAFHNGLSDEEAALLKLVLSLANCAMAVELHSSPRAPHSPFPHGIRVLRGGHPFG
jgi:hypothetical protein